MRGCSSSWSRKDYGCDVTFGGVTKDTAARGRKAGETLCRKVKQAVPAAMTTMHWMPPVEGKSVLRIVVMVDPDELAAFRGGPTHLREIAKARLAANLDRSWWELTEATP